MVTRQSFWHGKTVMVTGHTGFKGAWLTLWLAHLGAKVVGVALPADVPSLYRALDCDADCDSRVQDVRDVSGVVRLMRETQPDVVLHLAAQSLVRRSYEQPVETFDVNVLGVAHVLEGMRRTPSARVCVVITSDKCYENNEWDWGYRELDPMGGGDPYSASKGCAELVTQSYRASFFGAPDAPRLASARAGNVIGGGDWSRDRLVPDIMKAFMDGRPGFVRNPNAIRPWQHVLDPLHGYLSLAQKLWDEPGLASAWNFGPERTDERTVGEVADRLTALWGDGAEWRQSDPEMHAPHEASVLRLEIAKAAAKLRWRPLWPVDRALAETVAWYKDFAQAADVRARALRQIDAYTRERQTLHGRT